MAPIKGPHDESYEEFYSHWSEKQVEQLKELEAALESNKEESQLKELVNKAKEHYEYYYVAKDEAARQNILEVMNPSWKSPLETAFMWVGGWRPTLVFQLAYALAGQQLEAELEELLAGIDRQTMASLSSAQLGKINDMQVETQKQEEELSHRLAVLQQGMADNPFVGIAQATLAVTTPTTQGGEGAEGGEEGDGRNAGLEEMEGAVDEKLKQLEEILVEADTLRKMTLCNMVDILTPVQGAQYLVAAAQLQVAFRKVGTLKSQNGA